MIDPLDRQLNVSRQCELIDLSRSSYYYRPMPLSQEELELMRKIDELYLTNPSSGSRTISRQLDRQGITANRKRVQRLMRIMGIEAVYPKPRTSRPHPQHKIYPYLLRGLAINATNQVWATDITFIPMASGYMYLVAIMDWHSRKVLSRRISNTLDSVFCIEALQEALSRYGAPAIFNSDQGAQFTSNAFTQGLGTITWPSAWMGGAAARTTSLSAALVDPQAPVHLPACIRHRQGAAAGPGPAARLLQLRTGPFGP